MSCFGNGSILSYQYDWHRDRFMMRRNKTISHKESASGSGERAIGITDISDMMTRAITSHERREYLVAESIYHEVLHLVPAHPDATHFLGLLAHQTGRTQDGLSLLRRSLELNPNSALYRFNLAGVYQQSGLYAEAEHFYREALALKTDYTDARVGLAITEVAQGKYHTALLDYEHVLNGNPHHYSAEIGRIKLLIELGKADEAIHACYKSARHWNRDAKKLLSIGLAFQEAGADAAAAKCLECAVELSPDDVNIHNTLGIVLSSLGRLTDAKACYRKVLRLRPDYVGSFYNLVNLTRLSSADPIRQRFVELDEQTQNFSPRDAILLHFALGKTREDAEDYPNAFHHFCVGNKLKRAAIKYEENRQIQFVHDYIRHFDANFIATHSCNYASKDTPIFIVGMPRAGTTLVEQILSSHPLVYGAGETQQLWRSLRVEFATTARDDDNLASILTTKDSGTYRRIAQHYFESLNHGQRRYRYITNKLSGNMTLVGFIHMAFPNAKIIHCARDSMDTCTSCFCNLFASGNLFTYDLNELGRFYRLYEEVMQHWRKALPDGRMLDIRYEDVVDDLEGQARRILAYCGLPWSIRCLKFYKTKRTVRTASLVQVRRPIYASSIGRWKRYEEYLGPLKRALVH